MRRGSSAATSFLALLFSTLGTALRSLCSFLSPHCCVRHISWLPSLPTLNICLCVSSLTLFVITCEVLNSDILAVYSSFLACSAKRAAWATSLPQKLLVDKKINLGCVPSSSASAATVAIQNLSPDLIKALSGSSSLTQVLSFSCG